MAAVSGVSAPPPQASTSLLSAQAHTARNGIEPSAAHSTAGQDDRSVSPARPPISPITPSASFARLSTGNRDFTFTSNVMPPPPPPPPPAAPAVSSTAMTAEQASPTITQPPPAMQGQPPPATTPQETSSLPSEAPTIFIPPPDAVDFELDDNTDAMALRAAITILEMQKAKCRRDFQTLNLLKKSVKDEPDALIHEFLAGNMRRPPRPDSAHVAAIPYDELDSGDSSDDSAGAEDHGHKNSTLRFPHIPPMQQIARCPPINWAKYQVVGSVLDKMHDEQLARPTQGSPLLGSIADDGVSSSPLLLSGPPAAEHHVFKAYDEFEDGPPRPVRNPDAALSAAATGAPGVSTRRKSKK